MTTLNFDEAVMHAEAIKQAYDEYTARGYKCVPTEPKSKVIRVKEWQNRTFTREDFRGLGNIGVQLGAVSGNLVDIDLDHPTARKLATGFLPRTPWRFGRVYPGEGDSVIASHWLYNVVGGVKSSTDWKLSKKESGTDSIVKVMEYRGDGNQTVFPPSVHQSRVEWVEMGVGPATIDEADLKQALGVMMTIIWVIANIAPGIRHDALLRVMGGFAKAGVPIDVTHKAIRAIGFLTDDEEDRAGNVDDTYKRLAEGKTIVGFSSLSAFGWEVDRVKKWLPSKLSESGKVAKDGKPKLNLSRVSLEDAVNESIKILDAVPDAEKKLFSYGGRAVAVVLRAGNRYDDVQIIAPTTDALAHHLESYIQYVKSDAKEHVDIVVEVDNRLVRRMADPSINWGLPQLDGVVMYPVLTPEGTFLSKVGFCRESGLYIGDDVNITLDYVKSMTVAQAKDVILDVYDDFPFHSKPIGQAFSVTALLTAVARKAIRLSPMFIATSPYPQDGKTEWSFIPQLILSKTATNHAFGRSDEEQQKQLITYFSSDPPVILFDNQNGKFQSQALTELLTSGSFVGRYLGTNDQVSFKPRTLVIANGINVAPSAEIATRALIVEFDRRKDMNFKYPRLREHVLKNRRELLRAAYRLLLNGVEAGSSIKFEAGPSRFIEWDDFVRRAVVAAGFIDPMRGDLRMRVLDDDGEAREAMVGWLFQQFPPGSKFKSTEVFGRVGLDQNLENTIKAIARRQTFSTIVVGIALTALRGAEHSGHRLSWAIRGQNLMQGEWKPIVKPD